jgi:PleD family two-component response regulator
VAPHVTVSIGVSACVPQANMPPEWLVATADRAMYAAKQGGRNQVRAADEALVAPAGISQQARREAAAPRR